MLSLGSKTWPSSQILVSPVIFETTAGTLRQGHFLDLNVIAFCKNDRITISVPIILSINQWSLYHFKKYRMDNHIYISQLRTSFFFYKLLFEVKKIDLRLNKALKLTFILMFFDSAYPTRPSDTVTKTKYTIYYLFEFVSNLFYRILPTPIFKQLLFVVATAEIPKTWKRTSLVVHFLICKTQDCAINHHWIIQPKLIDCPSDTFFKFNNSPSYITHILKCCVIKSKVFLCIFQSAYSLKFWIC